MKEIGDFLVEGNEAVTAVEGWDVVGGVGQGGRGHCLRVGLASAVKADC